LPLPDSRATNSDYAIKSTPVTSPTKLDFAYSLPEDAKNNRRMRSRPTDGVIDHLPQNGGSQSTCVFDNRVYSPDGSTCSRCSDDEANDDETVTSPSDLPSPVLSQLTSRMYVMFGFLGLLDPCDSVSISAWLSSVYVGLATRARGF